MKGGPMKTLLVLAFVAASLSAVSGAAAATRVGVADDPKDQQPNLSGPNRPDIQQVRVAYDDSGKLTVTMHFWEPLPTTSDYRSMGASWTVAPPSDTAGCSFLEPGGLLITTNLYGTISPDILVGGYDGSLSGSYALSADRREISVSVSHTALAHRNYTCAEAETWEYDEVGHCGDPACTWWSHTIDLDTVDQFAVAPPRYALTVQKAGSGGGGVTSTPAGVTCGTTCTGTFEEGAVVTLTATPDAVSSFTGWSGACSGASSACTVALDQAKTVTATFALLPRRSLGVSKTGDGTGYVAGTGLSCGAACSTSLVEGTRAALYANPDKGSIFVGWGGDCAPAGVALMCSLTMTGDKHVVATFAALRKLRLRLAGSGRGRVLDKEAGINCRRSCTTTLAPSKTVVLTARPLPHNRFAGWRGACTGRRTCRLTMESDRTVTATFVKIRRPHGARNARG
jgi:hypothetical protein